MSETWPQSPIDTRLVIVDWRDIVEYDDWNSTEGDHSDVTVSTVGWLLEQKPQSITIASTFRYEDSRWAGIHVFPTAPPEIREVTPAKRGSK